MAPPLILCADIGTSSLKAAFIDTQGREYAFARETYVPQGPVEAADWERAFIRALGTLFIHDPQAKVRALCISGNGPTLVPVTTGGHSLFPLHWHDGPPPVRSGSFFLPHAVRLMRDRPGDYEKTRRFLSSQEWLSWRLGAEAVTVLPTPPYAEYYWDREQCAALGLDWEKFPPLVPMGSVIGRLSPEGLRRLREQGIPEGGLPPGIPIIAGGSDFIMALIGTGTLKPGLVCDRAGSSEGINVCCAAPAEPGELRVLPHAVPGLWNVSVVIPSSGRLFDWYRALTGQENRPYEAMLKDIAFSSPAPGAVPLFVPNLHPRRGEGKPGVFIAASGLMDKALLGRAVVETIAFQVRSALETLERRGFPVSELRLSGGQGKTALWNQLKADITGRTLLATEIADAELGGNGILGALALGEASDMAEAAAALVRFGEPYVPNPEAAERYEERYAAFAAASPPS